MKLFNLLIAFSFALYGQPAMGQETKLTKDHTGIVLVSDTQAPLGIEKLWLKGNQNELATKKIFEAITQDKPQALLILGDVVCLGSKESKWKEMDQYLNQVRNQSIPVAALLGNHDVMYSSTKGEAAFLKRFPDEVNTGFYKIYDSVAFLMLNSNFKALNQEQQDQQMVYYKNSLQQLDADPSIQSIVVACHHAPYSNSKIVGSNEQVQESFIPDFLVSKKAKLFITGHAHRFEHFKKQGKNFLTLGGGGGLHHPLTTPEKRISSESKDYDPEFHYLDLKRVGKELVLTSFFLNTQFSGFEKGYQFTVD